MEHGLGPLNQVSAALHTNCAGCSGATMNYQPFMLTDVANTFHVYSMNWSPQQITFLIDDATDSPRSFRATIYTGYPCAISTI